MSSQMSSSRPVAAAGFAQLFAPLFARLWQASPPLTATGLLMLAVAVPSLIGVFADPRTIGGAPAWLKPFKFATSTAIYALTLAWIFGYLTTWSRMRRVVGWTTAIVFVVEVAIIDLQAWRGTTSHFNAATPLDSVLYMVMGVGIMLQTVISVWVAIALWRQHFADRALGTALRYGMTLTLAGAMVGPLMTRPTSMQLERVRAGDGMPIIGAHTVGGVDGGAGLPVTGWSREHGDLRVSHFVGLHAIQVLGILALMLARAVRDERLRVRMVQGAAGSYTLLFLVLLWSALRGQSVVDPDALTRTALILWAGASALVLGWITFLSRSTPDRRPA